MPPEYHTLKKLFEGNGMGRSLLVSVHNFSVTWWLGYFSTFGHLHHWTFAQWQTNFGKVDPKFCQIFSKNTLKKLYKTFKILPNLITNLITLHCLLIKMTDFYFVWHLLFREEGLDATSNIFRASSKQVFDVFLKLRNVLW